MYPTFRPPPSKQGPFPPSLLHIQSSKFATTHWLEKEDLRLRFLKNLKDNRLTEAIPPKIGNVLKRSCYEMRPRLMNFVEFQNSFQFNHKSFVRELVPACLLEKLGKTHLSRLTMKNSSWHK